MHTLLHDRRMRDRCLPGELFTIAPSRRALCSLLTPNDSSYPNR
jgi:hypothetical protein